MTGKKPKYQHAVPQQDSDHYPTPKSPTDLRCKGCGKTVVRVGPDEGPEGLKALMRF